MDWIADWVPDWIGDQIADRIVDWIANCFADWIADWIANYPYTKVKPERIELHAQTSPVRALLHLVIFKHV